MAEPHRCLVHPLDIVEGEQDTAGSSQGLMRGLEEANGVEPRLVEIVGALARQTVRKIRGVAARRSDQRSCGPERHRPFRLVADQSDLEVGVQRRADLFEQPGLAEACGSGDGDDGRSSGRRAGGRRGIDRGQLSGASDEDPAHGRRPFTAGAGFGGADRFEVDGPDLAGLAGLGSDDRGGDDAARAELFDDGDLAGVQAIARDAHTSADGETGSALAGGQIDRGDGGAHIGRIGGEARGGRGTVGGLGRRVRDFPFSHWLSCKAGLVRSRSNRANHRTSAQEWSPDGPSGRAGQAGRAGIQRAVVISPKRRPLPAS